MAGDQLPADQDAALRAEILRIVTAEHPITCRGLYYQCVLSPALPWLTKDKSGSRRTEGLIGRRCLDMRRSGVIPWDWITDESRTNYGQRRWDSPDEFAAVAPWYYRRDLWARLPERPVVLVEKAAAIGTVLDHCRSYGVDTWATKGYGSASYLKDLAASLRPHLEQGQAIQALVLADFDPSGWGWPQAAETEIRFHLQRFGLDPQMISFDRILLTQQQAAWLGDEVSLRPPNTADTRTLGFLDAHSIPYQLIELGKAKQVECLVECCAELDAMRPSDIRQLLSDRFEQLAGDELDQQRELETVDRDRIRTALIALS